MEKRFQSKEDKQEQIEKIKDEKKVMVANQNELKKRLQLNADSVRTREVKTGKERIQSRKRCV